MMRTAHGKGAASALVVVETRPFDELPPLNANDTAAGLAIAAARGRPFERGNAAARGRRPALASGTTIPLDATDPEYRKALKWARRYRRKRISELEIQHGGKLSVAVCGLITTASLDLAAHRFLTKRASKMSPGREQTATMLAAARLGQTAKTAENAACELAARDAAVQPKAPVNPLVAIRARIATEKKPEAAT